jgi:hypothetical protein
VARPRVFISSTFYDLRYIREDLERFIQTLGYEPVRHEKGSIPYSKQSPLETSAYREVGLSDIIVCVIGGRYGTDSSTRAGSITQNELAEALQKGIQVYIFVEQNVHGEFSTFQLNKGNKTTKYGFVEDVRVYEFLEQIYALPQNNPITPFSTSADICIFLQAQWAGLFQRFLQEERRLAEINVLQEMKTVAGTLQQLVTFLTEERKNKDDAIKNILVANHPAFRSFANLLKVKYRVFFTDRAELDAWLRARNYVPTKKDTWDEDSKAEWIDKSEKKYIKLTHNIFDNAGRLKPYSENEWQEDWVQEKEIEPPPQLPPLDDDIPF